jgi:hypothetical protein
MGPILLDRLTCIVCRRKCHPSINSTGNLIFPPFRPLPTPIHLINLGISPLQLSIRMVISVELRSSIPWHDVVYIHIISHLTPEHLHTCLDFGLSHHMIFPPISSKFRPAKCCLHNAVTPCGYSAPSNLISKATYSFPLAYNSWLQVCSVNWNRIQIFSITWKSLHWQMFRLNRWCRYYSVAYLSSLPISNHQTTDP